MPLNATTLLLLIVYLISMASVCVSDVSADVVDQTVCVGVMWVWVSGVCVSMCLNIVGMSEC